MASTITTPNGVQHIPPQASAGPTVPDPTGAPDGQVVTTASGALVLATPSGGPTIGSGTYAARPASPTVGDSYTVTSGARRGSVYRCDVAGAWSLVTLAVPQLGACVGLFDGERGIERAGSLLRRWNNLAPRGRGYDVSWFQTNSPQPVAAVGATGLLAYDTSAGSTAMRGVLPAPATSAARTLAILAQTTAFSGGNPAHNYALSWGSANGSASFNLGPRINFSDVWGATTNGTNLASAVSGTESGYVVLVATYDGTTGRVYREGTEIASGAMTLNGDATDSYLGIMASAWGDTVARGTLAFAGAWDAALSAGEVTTLTSLLRERYGL